MYIPRRNWLQSDFQPQPSDDLILRGYNSQIDLACAIFIPVYIQFLSALGKTKQSFCFLPSTMSGSARSKMRKLSTNMSVSCKNSPYTLVTGKCGLVFISTDFQTLTHPYISKCKGGTISLLQLVRTWFIDVMFA